MFGVEGLRAIGYKGPDMLKGVIRSMGLGFRDYNFRAKGCRVLRLVDCTPCMTK